MNKNAQNILSTKSLRISILFLVLLASIIFIEFNQWKKVPEIIVNEMYASEYKGQDKKILQLSQTIQSLKKEKYSEPMIGSYYSDGKWFTTVDFMLYSDTNDVIGGKTLLIVFKSNFNWLNPLHPTLTGIIEFQELERGKLD